MKNPIINLKSFTHLLKLGLFIVTPVILVVSWQKEYRGTHIEIPLKVQNSKNDHVGKGIRSIASEIKMIELEANSQALLGKSCGMRPASFGFVIWDPQSKKVYTFDDMGKFIATIGRPGKGPLEYIRMVNCVPDPFSDQIYIIDQGGKKILCYRSTGEFVSSISLAVDPSGPMVVHEKNVLTLLYQDWKTTIDSERIGILQVNQKGEILARKLLGTGLKRGDFNSHTVNKLIKVKDDFLYSVYPHTIVYKTDFKLIKEEEFLSFELGEMQASYKIKLEKDHVSQTEEKVFVRSFSVFKDKIWIEIVNQTYGQVYLFDMKSGKLEFISMLGMMKDDLTGSNPFWPMVFSNDFMYELEDPGTIELFANQYGIALHKHFPGWNLDDNPTIRIAVLK